MSDKLKGYNTMTDTIIDAKGKACPIPFMLAKKEIDHQVDDFIVLVDNRPAVENLKKLASTFKYSIDVQSESDGFIVRFSTTNQQSTHKVVAVRQDQPSGWVLLIGTDMLGTGDPQLGTNLMRMFLYSIGQQEPLPADIMLINKGVRLACEDVQSIQTLTELTLKGTRVHVCGTCTNFYNFMDHIQIGSIINMYDLTRLLISAPKVISV